MLVSVVINQGFFVLKEQCLVYFCVLVWAVVFSTICPVCLAEWLVSFQLSSRRFLSCIFPPLQSS